eukprot:SAG11_NODE_887_length_6694_cov_21.780440_4_plen_78_part_00
MMRRSKHVFGNAACYSGGTIIVSLLAQQFAGQGLGQAGPSIQAFVKARQAAYEILQVCAAAEGKDTTHRPHVYSLPF